MCGGTIVGHRLNDALVHVESRLDKLLAVARCARARDVKFGSGPPGFFFQARQSFVNGLDRVAVIHGVMAENYLPFFAGGGACSYDFCSGRT